MRSLSRSSTLSTQAPAVDPTNKRNLQALTTVDSNQKVSTEAPAVQVPAKKLKHIWDHPTDLAELAEDVENCLPPTPAGMSLCGRTPPISLRNFRWTPIVPQAHRHPVDPTGHKALMTSEGKVIESYEL